MTPAEWYSSAEFRRVHQELAEQRDARDRARLAARTPEQVRADAREAAWERHELCAKSGERGCSATDGHVCREGGPRPGARDPAWRDPLLLERAP